MSVLDQITADTTALILGDLGTTAAWSPASASSTTSISVAWGDEIMASGQMDSGDQSARTARLLASLAAIKAANLTLLSDGREPRRGDRLVVASGHRTGTWVVTGVALDDGDGAQLDVELFAQTSTGGRAVRGA